MALLIGLSLVIVAVRHGHITTKLMGLLTTLLYVVTVALVCWLFWPTVDTLVHQARNNDTRGMKRSLFLVSIQMKLSGGDGMEPPQETLL